MESNLAHWEAQAGTPLTKDVVAKELEVRTIIGLVDHWQPTTIVDMGCGDGETARAIARLYPCHVIGIDFSPRMVEVAQERMLLTGPLEGTCEFRVGNVLDGAPPADLTLTERCLINLPDWATQRRAILKLAVQTKRLALMENCIEGVEKMNRARKWLGLKPIVPPTHNTYLSDFLVRHAIEGHPPTVHCYSDTYYYLSRVVNAGLARPGEPDYNAPINRLALELPNMGTGYGQGRVWFWDLTDRPYRGQVALRG